MIFKTFDDGKIDKWTAKIGIFGKSFNELGTAINNAFQSTINNIDNFDNDIGFWKSLKDNLFPKKEDIQSKMIDVDALIPKIDDNTAQGILGTIREIEDGVHSEYKTFQELYDTGDKQNQWIAEYAQNTKGQIRSTEGVIQANQQARESAIAYNNGLKQMTLGAKAANVAIKGLSIAGNMLVGMGISFVISKISTAIDNHIHRVEKAQEAIKEITSAITEMNDKLKDTSKTVKDSGKRFAELAQGVNQLTGKNLTLNTEDYEEFLDLSNQLAELFPTLPRIFDENGNAIVQLSGDVDTIVGSLKNLVDVQRQITNQEIADKLPDLYANTKTVADDYESQLKELNGDYEYYQGLVSKLNKFNYDDLKNIGTNTDTQFLTAYSRVLAKLGIATGAKGGFDDYGNHVVKILTLPFVTGDDYLASLEDVKDQIPKVVNELLEEYNTEVEKLSTDINITNEKNKANWSSLAGSIAAWLNTEDLYKIMSDDMQSTVQNIVNGLDWSTLASWDDAKQYIQDNILSLFQTSDGRETLKDIEIMFGIQTQFNNGEITVNEYQEKLQSFLDQIKELAPETQKVIKLIFGIQTEDDGSTSSSVDTMVNNVKEKLKDEFDDKVGELSLEDLDIASKLEIPEGTLLSWDELLAKIEEVKNSNPDKAKFFSDVWDSSTFADTKKKLLELAKSGELTPETLESTEDYKKLIDDTGLSAEYCAKRINNLVTAQEKLSNVTKGISSISDLYTQARDEGFVDINDIMSLDNTWKDLKSFEEFTNIVGSGTYSMSEMQQAFDKLVSEYLNYSDALIKLDETNKDLYIKQLKSVGVSNAQALVEERLTANYIEENNALEGLTEANKEEYIAKLKANNITDADVIVTNKLNAKKEAENTVTKELNMTMDEFLSKSFDMQNSLLGEANASDICRGEIAQLQLAEINYNKSGLDVSGKIKQLKDLVTAYGLADTEAQKMAKREQEMRDYEAKTGAYTGFRYTEADYKHAEEDTKKRIEALFGGLGQYTYTAPDYNGGEDRQKELSEKNTDWIETKVSRIQRLITNIGKTISATYKTWKERIGAVKSETAKLTEELSIQQQAANYYLNKANSVGLSADYVNKIQNGAILIEDGIDEKTQEKIDKYTELYEKYLEALDSMEDIRGEIADNFKEKFDMVASSYDNAISLIESKSGILDSLVSKQETDDHLVSKAYYQSLKNLQNQNIAELQSKRTDLVKAFNEAMANGNIKQYSEDWYDMKNSIMEVEQALIDANTQLIELDNNMRDLDWKVFDLKQQYIGRIQEEADYLIDLMSNKDLYDDYGKMNDSGISTAGLHVTNYDVYLKQAQKYADEIKEIDKLLAKDSSDTELIERRNELIDSHRDMVKSAKDEQQAIIDMVEEGYNRLLDALNEIIDKRKEQLDAEKDLYDYERSIAEKTKNISSLQKQLSAYEGDNSEETQAKIQQIKVDLEEAKQDLQDAEYDKWMSDQEQMLDRLSSDTQEWIEARMNNIEAIMQDIINQTNENATLIKDTLVEQTDNLGSFISGEMSKIFSDGSPVSSFIESFTNEDSGVLKVINGIALNVQTMVDKLAGQAKSEIASNGATTTNSTKSSTTQKSTSKTTSSTPSTTKSTTKNTSSSNGNKDYKFIYAKSYYPKNKLNRKTSIDDALAFYDYDWSFNAKKKYYKDLIGNDAYTGSYNQNVALLKKFREIKGYNQGGVIGELKNIIGRNNDNSLAINTFEKGEGIIPLPLMGDWKTLINNLEPLNASMDFLNKALIPNIKANRSTNETVNNDVQLSITLPNVTNYDEFKNALVKDKNFEKVVQSMTFGNALGKNSLNKNKY